MRVVITQMRKITTLILALMSVVSIPFLTKITDRIAGEETETVETEEISDFDQAVAIIKKYETLHQPRHWPLVGYGHKVLPGEKFSRTKALSEKEADALLRKDLLKNCAVFRSFGKDSLLLGVLAYNIGSGATLRSSVVTKLKAGNRDIRSSYIAHCKYRGKTHNQIQKRRIEEFDALFVTKIVETPIESGAKQESLAINASGAEAASVIPSAILSPFPPLSFIIEPPKTASQS